MVQASDTESGPVCMFSDWRFSFRKMDNKNIHNQLFLMAVYTVYHASNIMIQKLVELQIREETTLYLFNISSDSPPLGSHW